MDPLKSFEKKLLSGSLIDTTKLKSNRPPWLEGPRVPRIYKDLETLVIIPGDNAAVQPALDTGRVYQVLLASGLSQQILAAIWDQCSKTVPGSLVQSEFYQALALVALSQNGSTPDVQMLTNLQAAPIPRLAIAGYPCPLPPVPQTSLPHQEVPTNTVPEKIEEVTVDSFASQQPAQDIVSGIPSGQPNEFSEAPSNQSAFEEEEEDDFADFQSAPADSEITTKQSFDQSNSKQKTSFSFNGHNQAKEQQQSTQHISFPIVPKVPNSKPNGASVVLPSILPSMSLFDTITIPVTETVQPPTQNNPWLGFTLEPDPRALAKKRAAEMKAKLSMESPDENPIVENHHTELTQTKQLNGTITESEDDFDDFQSAVVSDSVEVTTNNELDSSDQDKYSAFRMLEEPSENSPEIELMPQEPSSEESVEPSTQTVDILSMIKLPSIPLLTQIDNPEGDLSIFDTLTHTSSHRGDHISALDDLQDLNIGFTTVDGPVATNASSTEASPAKSVASEQSIGESRGKEGCLSIFSHKANYSECASLSSFELGPENTESNNSSPTKGSVLSLELNSPKRTIRQQNDDEEDKDDTLEWTIEAPTENRENNEERKKSEEFCWAQPPVFPPPDPTYLDKSAVNFCNLNTDIYLPNFPNSQSRTVSREQVTEKWSRILSKAAAILESASVILGDDPLVLSEIISTAKGQGYVANLLEVYNVAQQLKKATELFNIEGLRRQFSQVDDLWRNKLEDLTTRLHLSVICLDHLSLPPRPTEDTCAICLLPLGVVRLPHILFGDNGYHSSCANFWVNVLAEGLPYLKLNCS